MLLGLFLMIKSQIEFFKKLTQNTDEPSKLREKSVNEVLVLGPLHTLHIRFLRALFFPAPSQQKGQASGSQRVIY